MEWISVLSLLPAWTKNVLCIDDNGYCHVAYRTRKQNPLGEWSENYNITHWQYLPEPPVQIGDK